MTTMTDAEFGALLRNHAREAVRRSRAWHAAAAERRRELETGGYRLVGGDGDANTGEWEITDYRTGQVLASGTDGIGDYDSAAERLDAETQAAGGRGIIHDDHVYDSDALNALLSSPPAPEGIPVSLADAVADWAEEADDRGDKDALRLLGLGPA